MSKDVIQIEDINKNTKVVHISGEIDINNVDKELDKVNELIKKYPKKLNLIFDLKNLDYINSNGIGRIINISEIITENGGKMIIANAKPNVLDILNTIGISNLINIYGSINEALESINPVYN